MTIRVLVNGAKGRMGKVAVQAIQSDPELTLVGEAGRGDNLANAISDNKADVVIDFTNANEVLTTTNTIINTGARPVIGTSGLTMSQVKSFQAVCSAKKLGGIIAPNFSVAAVLAMRFAQEAAKYFPQVEIIEMHHDGKLDSPSGTSIRTAELIAESRVLPVINKQEKEVLPGARGVKHNSVPIHSIRLPGLLAHQKIIFGTLGETLTIQHDSTARESFMPGVCLACKKVVTMNELVYGLENIL